MGLNIIQKQEVESDKHSTSINNNNWSKPRTIASLFVNRTFNMQT